MAKWSCFPTFTPHTPETVLRWVAVFLAVSVLIVCCEFAALLLRNQLGHGSLFDWKVLRLRRAVVAFAPVRHCLDLAFGNAWGTGFWLLAGGGCAVATVLGFGRPTSLLAAGAVTLFLVMLAIRFAVGRDGADQLAVFLSATLFTYLLAPSAVAARIALYLICAELTASYFVSGVAKVTARSWMRGTALHGILKSSCYGHPRLAARVDPRAARWMGMGVAAFELAFPLVWFADARVGLALLLGGLCFHLSVWLIMGLNSFFFTFLAGYPALLWLVSSR